MDTIYGRMTIFIINYVTYLIKRYFADMKMLLLIIYDTYV